MGGDIAAESTPGRGSCCALRVPADIASAPPVAEHRRIATVAEPAVARLGRPARRRSEVGRHRLSVLVGGRLARPTILNGRLGP
jgi:hypothetical protein